MVSRSINSQHCLRPEGSSPLLQNPPVVPILSHINSSQTIYLRFTLVSSHLRLGLSCGLFPSSFRNKILYGLLASCSVSTRGLSPIESRGHKHLLPRLPLWSAEGQITFLCLYACMFTFLFVCTLNKSFTVRIIAKNNKKMVVL